MVVLETHLLCYMSCDTSMSTGDQRSFPITRPSTETSTSSVTTEPWEPCWLVSVGRLGCTGDSTSGYGRWLQKATLQLFGLVLYKTICVFIYIGQKSKSVCMSQHSNPRSIAEGSALACERQISAQIPLNMWIISNSAFLWCIKFWQLIGKNLCAMLGGVSRLPGVKPKET